MACGKECFEFINLGLIRQAADELERALAAAGKRSTNVECHSTAALIFLRFRQARAQDVHTRQARVAGLFGNLIELLT